MDETPDRIPEPLPDDDGIISIDAFEEIMRGRLPDSDRAQLELLSKVAAEYVHTGRDDLFSDMFRRYFKRMLTAKKGQVIFVTGDSGAGKSKIVEHLLATHPLMQRIPTPMGPLKPYVSVTMQGPATLRAVGSKIVQAATGITPKDSVKENQIWENLAGQLAHRRVKIVHIDEVQHALRSEYDAEKLADSLKGLMNNAAWPIGLILSGLPQLNTMLQFDEQSERRQFSFPLPPVPMPDGSATVKKIISQLCGAAGLDCKKMLTEDVPDRIAHAARYQLGRISEVTFAAIQIAIEDGDTFLGREHFADAYVDHSHARDKAEVNPFRAEHWQHLSPGYFIIQKPGQERG